MLGLGFLYYVAIATFSRANQPKCTSKTSWTKKVRVKNKSWKEYLDSYLLTLIFYWRKKSMTDVAVPIYELSVMSNKETKVLNWSKNNSTFILPNFTIFIHVSSWLNRPIIGSSIGKSTKQKVTTYTLQHFTILTLT